MLKLRFRDVLNVHGSWQRRDVRELMNLDRQALLQTGSDTPKIDARFGVAHTGMACLCACESPNRASGLLKKAHSC